MGSGTLAAAPDIPGADYDTDLRAHVMHAANDPGRLVHFLKIEKILVRLKRFSAQLQHNPVINGHGVPP